MKRLLITAAATLALAAPVLAADIGVSVSIGQPGFYGQIDIGGFPRPQLLYPQPVMIQAVPMGRPPLYLRVPPGHAKHWSKHCRKYRACGERVYFVRDDWYTREYAPRYQERHRDRDNYQRSEYRDGHRDDRRGDRNHDGYRSNDRDHDRDNGRGKDHRKERGDDRGDDHGRGHGNGR